MHTDAFLKISKLTCTGRFAHALSVQIALAVAVREMQSLHFTKARVPSKESQLVITNANVGVRCSG